MVVGSHEIRCKATICRGVCGRILDLCIGRLLAKQMVKPDEMNRTTGSKSFDELLSDLSLRLLKATPGHVNNEIRQAIKEIGEHCGVDSVQFRRFSEDRSISTLLHWWVRSNAIGLSAELSNDQIPWAASLLLRGIVVRISQLSDMPPEAASGRALMEQYGLQSAMLVPVEVDDQVYGALVLASQEEREWSDEIARETRFMGDALANALARAQLHDSLWTSEARLRAVVENQTEFIVRWLPDGTRTWVNDSYCALYQQSRESIIGTGILPLASPADRQRVLDNVKAMTPDNPVQIVDHQVLLPSGEAGWQNWTDKGIFNDSGELLEILSIGRDISNQKSAEEATIASEARYRSLVENTTDWIWEMNLDFEHTYGNKQAEVILGYTPHEIGELSPEQLFHPDDLSEIKQRLPDLIARKSGWEQWLVRLRHKDGSYRYLQSNATPMFDPEGNLCGYQGIDRDVTESVTAAELMEKSEEKYRALFESANDAILLLDGERITDCNSKALEVFHRERDELIDKTPWDISVDYQEDGLTSKEKGQAMLKNASSGNSMHFDWLHSRPDGTPINMEISLSRVNLVFGGNRILAIARDVTQFNHAQKEISRQARFQTRLAKMSAMLLKRSDDQLIQLCRSELEKIAREFDIDAAAIWWYPKNRQSINRVIAWRHEDYSIEPAPDSLALANVDWSAELLLAGELIQIDDVARLPEEAKGTRDVLQGLGINALLGFSEPLEDVPWGACACIFSMLKPRQWSQTEIQELQLLGVPLSNGLTRHLAKKEVVRQADFQQRLASLSANLLRAPIEKMEQCINEELVSVGEHYELGSIGIWWIPADNFAVVNRYAGWRAAQESWPVQYGYDPRAYAPWFVGRLASDEIAKIDDVSDLSNEARVDQASFKSWGISSVLGIPTRVDNRIAGCCIFSSFEQRTWDDETVQELRLIADALISACALAKATDELVQSERDLARSQEVAGVGSYSFIPEGEYFGFPPKGTLKLSPQFRELFGINTGQPTFDKVTSRIHPNDSERVLDAIKDDITSGTGFHHTYRVVRPDGSVVHVENRSTNEFDETNHTRRIFGTVHNVTERVESREEIEGALAEIEKLRDELREENVYLRDEIRVAHGFDKIIGESSRLRKALLAAEKVAPTGVPVLILGETGTGKELIAQSIHDLSGRKDHAMISVNCAALSKDLIASELFGHEKGAFTGAHSQRKGLFERADGGTLFLDEIGDLPGELQAKLLRVLQTGDFERLGGSTTLSVDVRLLAATNKNLQDAADKGEFRADLFYRIASFPIELPPLRERAEDIPALAEFLVRKHGQRMGKDIQSISARTIRYLTAQSWPGNVRELEGFIQRALISTMGPVLDYSEAQEPKIESPAASGTVPANESADLRNAERNHILKVLESSRWVIDGKRGAAAMMGIAPSTLRSKMKRLEIRRPE